MNPGENRPSVLALMGPTGSGKTDFVAGLDPERYEVVSCDSRQMYRELPIGTAAPDAQILAKMPHHCVGIADPDFTVSASFFVDVAGQAVGSIIERGKTPVFVGGTGFYYTAFKTGLFDAPHDPELRKNISQMSMDEKLKLLEELDPHALVKGPDEDDPDPIHPNDKYRIERAIEVSQTSKKPWSLHWRERKKNPVESPYRFEGWRIDMERVSYRKRLEERARMMVDAGFVSEASKVYKKYGDCPGLRSLGYDFAIQAAMGEMSRDELIEKITISHYRYGKRQMAWFAREKELQLIGRDDLEVVRKSLL